MKGCRRYIVTLEVVVTDRQALLKTARDQAEEQGCGRGVIKNCADALQWILDPGSQPEEGWEIEHSACEEAER
jgi:hypothetical protein